jgi:hypothetical protein
MNSPAVNPTNFQILRDANNQEYVETCEEWVRATLVMFDNAPHIRVQEHHAAGSGRLHLGPLIPLDEWLLFKGAVDTLVGPFLRDPQNAMSKPTLSSKLEYAILASISVLSERRLQDFMGGWFNRVRERVPEPFEHNDLLFALKRLSKRGYLRLTKLDGTEYSGNPREDSSFFFDREFIGEITPEGWSRWESLRS